MPTPQSNQVLALAGTVFAEGYVTMTLPGGVANGVTVGVISDFTISTKLTKKKLMGPGSKGALAVGIAEREVLIKAKNATFDLRQAIGLMGGTVAFASGNTTLTSLGNDNPPLLSIQFKTPSDGSDVTMTATKCIADTSDWAFKTHEFFEQDWQCEVYPDPNSTPTANAWFTIVVIGNETAS